MGLTLAFLLPGHYPPWTSFQHQWLAAVSVCGLIAFSSLRAHRRSPQLQLPPLALISAASACLPVVQWSTGQILFLSDAILPTLYLIGFFFCITAGINVTATLRDKIQSGIFFSLTAAASISVGLALFQWLRLGQNQLWLIAVKPSSFPYANLGQHNHLGTLCMIGIFGTLYQFQNQRLGRLSASILALWLGFGLILAQSRTAWLALLLLAIANWVLHRRLQPRTPPKILIAYSLGVLIVASLWPTLNEHLFLDSVVTLKDRTLGEGGRLVMWKALINATASSPWEGFGWNQVTLAQQAAAPQIATKEMTQDSHNLILDLVLWGGIPFGALWTIVLALWLKSATNNIGTAQNWLTLCGVLSFLIHTMLEYPHEYTYFLFPIAILMGTLTPEARGVRIRSSVILPLMITSTATFLWVSIEYMKVEENTRNLRFLLAGIGIDKIRDVPPPDVVLLDGPREYNRYMTTAASRGMPVAKIQWMHKVVQRYPYPPALLRYALAQGLNEDNTGARSTLNLLCSMHPSARCLEGQSAWLAARLQWPELREIQYPPIPANIGR